jgi:steroid delta-isomerase-like uncharacterized protein
MATTKPTTEARLRAIADEVFAAWNDHDPDAILDHLTEDVAWMEPVLDGPIRGKEAVAAHLRDTFTAYPDLHLLEDEFHLFPDPAQSASVSVWTVTGTNTGPSKETGLPATGKSVRFSGANFARVRDDRISEYVLFYDALDLLQQVGALPKSDGLGFKALVMADVMIGKATDQAMKVIRR